MVGVDELGNKYYRSKKKKRWGREQRWCIFKGEVESSNVPAEWHGWLHHTVEEPLTTMVADSKPWSKSHEPNLTGTAQAYRPKGHALKGGERARATGDYEAWTPE
tara:strand:- start:783 stop:1097 length:315 start_codon:yes stop_codon:yes gene_type:complete